MDTDSLGTCAAEQPGDAWLIDSPLVAFIKSINFMHRDKRGRFAKAWKWTKRILLLSFIGAIAAGVYGDFWSSRELSVIKSPIPVVEAGITAEAKIAATKEQLVESLAKDCETKGVKEPDAAIIFDDNNEPSIGAWQYQRKTVQHYYKQLYGKEISRTEAIEIAIDHDKAAALTLDILFKVDGGWKNWLICAQRLDLPVQIELLKKLDV